MNGLNFNFHQLQKLACKRLCFLRHKDVRKLFTIPVLREMCNKDVDNKIYIAGTGATVLPVTLLQGGENCGMAEVIMTSTELTGGFLWPH